MQVIKSGKNKLPLHKMVHENLSTCNSFKMLKYAFFLKKIYLHL